MIPYYYKEIDLPQIPRDILFKTPLGPCTRLTEDMLYGSTLLDPQTDLPIRPITYIINTFTSPELVNWLDQHLTTHPELKNVDLSSIKLQTQRAKQPGLAHSHPVHSDIGLDWCLLYTLRCGGDPNQRPITRWYQELNQPLERAKSGPTSQSDTGAIDYKNLTVLEEALLLPEHWYMINISVLHDVQGITQERQSLRILAEPNK